MYSKEKQRIYQKDLYQYYKEHGICVCCKVRDTEDNKVLCKECREKKRLRNVVRKKQGICTVCGKSSNGRVVCCDCNKRDHERKIDKKHRVSCTELQYLHSMVYFSSCPSNVDIDSIIQKALMDYLDNRKKHIEAWRDKNE